MTSKLTAIGLMSGTSFDGVDAAVLKSDGGKQIEPGATAFLPYADDERAILAQAIEQAAGLSDASARPGMLDRAERIVTDAHIEAVRKLQAEAGLDPGRIDVIGFHGQTVLHAPARHLTIQLGDGARLAHALGIDTVCDFRTADVAAGGEGAPLVPVYHRALLASKFPAPLAVVNIGGVSNVTWIGKAGDLLAFDTGPGNALIDDWMARKAGVPHDDGGACALAGKLDHAVLVNLMDHEFFAARPPKSLDRNAFDASPVEGLGVADGAATLAAFTAHAISAGRKFLAEAPETWLLCGGGQHNRAIVEQLKSTLPGEVLRAEEAGIDGDFIEAQAFAYLAIRSLKGKPLTFPGTTGVANPLTGGVLHKAAADAA
jgi:anhydro-N-acetylmuramic acid kinase